MQQVEALREVKSAEDEVKRLRENAAREAAEAIRTAERRATEIVESAKADAESAHAAAIREAHESVGHERKRVLAAGESEARALAGKTTGTEFNRAVDLVLANLDKRVNRGRS